MQYQVPQVRVPLVIFRDFGNQGRPVRQSSAHASTAAAAQRAQQTPFTRDDEDDDE